MKTIFLPLVLFMSFVLKVNSQDNTPIELLTSSKQSSISIRPEVSLFSQNHAFGLEVGEFTIHPKPGIAIGYGKRFRLYKELGVELGIFGGITRFAYSANAPKENFSLRSHTYEQSESLINPFLSIPLLLNFQRPLNNKFLLILYGGANFKAHFMEELASGVRFSNAPSEFPTGDVFDVSLIFRNKPISTGIIAGAGIGRMLPNHNILQINLWANIGLNNQAEGAYYFYDQKYNSSGEKIENYIAGAGTIETKGSMVGTELRYTLTGIRKRLKAVQ